MYKKGFLLTFFLAVACFECICQTIQIKITDSADNNIIIAYTRFYSGAHQDSLVDYQVVRNGLLLYNVQRKNLPGKLIVTSPGYNESVFFLNETDLNTSSVSIVLRNDNIKSLAPVVVTAKRNPVQIKNDTTIYKVDAFKDGTERKLADLLKKLPGIEVNEKSGEVRFKGKPVETVLLEGNDLFGKDYTIGTKNINAAIVAEVQAIENYSDNYVLKGLIGEDKVALNIKINNPTLKLSTAVDAGLGYHFNKKPALDGDATLLGLSQVHHFFATAGYNNIGDNRSPEDYFGSNPGVAQSANGKYLAKKYVEEADFSSFAGDNRLNFNSQFFGNYNGLLRLNSKMITRVSSYYSGDKLKNNEVVENKYIIAADTITTIDSIGSVKMPTSYHLAMDYRYSISSRSLLEINSDYSSAAEAFSTVSVSNYIPVHMTRLQNNDFFLNNVITYTTRLNKTHALVLKGQETKSKASQNYFLSPSLFKRTIYESDDQLGKYLKSHLEASATIVGVRRNTNYSFFLKAVLNDSRYNGRIVNDSVNIPLTSSINRDQYYNLSFVQGASGSIQCQNLKIVPAWSLSLVQHHLSGFSTGEIKVIMEPGIAAILKLSNQSAVSVNYSLVQAPETEEHIFENNVIQNFRTVLVNVPSIRFLQTGSLKLQYSFIDLYNQFDQSFGISFHNKENGYLPAYTVTDSLTYTRYSVNKINNRSIDLFLYAAKYVPSMQVTFNSTLSYSINTYKNLVDASGLRNNKGNMTSVELFGKSSLKGPLNVENNLLYTISTSGLRGGSHFHNEAVTEHFRIIFKPVKTVTMFVTADFYFPNTAVKKNFTFLDYDFISRPRQKKFEFRVSMRNLLDLKRIIQYEVSDFYSGSYSVNCRPRSILFSFAMNF